MNKAYLLTGGNLGNRLNNLSEARKLIEQYCGKIDAQSSIYETAAWGFKDQPDFYNQALEVATKLSSEELMKTILMIEEKMGRKRSVKMGPRIIDIDILLFNDEIIHQPHLTIPHGPGSRETYPGNAIPNPNSWRWTLRAPGRWIR